MIAAVDIGGTKIAAAAFYDDQLGDVAAYPCPASQGREAVLDVVRHAVSEQVAAHGPAMGIAVSTAGVVDSDTGRILSATANLHGWGGTRLAEELTETFGIPVAVIGDGHAHGLGLWRERADRPSSLLAVAVGTGIGGSLILGGQPLLGAHHAAGHIGHVPVSEATGLICPCGAEGHVEAVASGRGMLAWYHRHGGRPDVQSLAALVQLSTAGTDPAASDALTVGGTALGSALAGLVNTLDPVVVSVSGGASQGGTHWRNAVRKKYAAGLMTSVADVALEFANPDPGNALRGAATWAIERWNR